MDIRPLFYTFQKNYEWIQDGIDNSKIWINVYADAPNYQRMALIEQIQKEFPDIET